MWNWYQSLIALRKRFRQSGLLHGDRLSVEADAEIGLFRLTYTKSKETLTVVVRLGEPKVDAEPVKVSSLGEVLLSTGDNTDTFDGMLAPNEAVVFLEKG